ncbi:MAG: 30S ribosomal protein S2 [Candidatus Anstonellales archaeon]
MEEETSGLLLPVEKYLESGIHIGTKLRNADTIKFIYKKRKDGIYIIDMKAIDNGIRDAINELKNYKQEEICIIATRVYATNAAKKAQKFLPKIDIVSKRFIPGTFTNPEAKQFREPSIVIVCDPRSEREAIKEASYMKIPIIGLVDTDNSANGINYVIPMNNKGRKSLAVFFWLFVREMLLKEGKIKSYDEFKVPISYFERLELEGE